MRTEVCVCVCVCVCTQASANLFDTMDKGGGITNVIECWGFLQLKIAHYFNSELPGVNQQLMTMKVILSLNPKP